MPRKLPWQRSEVLKPDGESSDPAPKRIARAPAKLRSDHDVETTASESAHTPKIHRISK